ncbi:MAG: glycosyltransferase [Acaryochloris sp. RU_4_1]|nr:glycosyltransferase [Acaryochloris sp. RU_4_1]
MKKLLILPGICTALGGTLITLSSFIKACQDFGLSPQVRVLVWSGSLMETYLQDVGQGEVLQAIAADSQPQFLQRALQWVYQQPQQDPLLLDNCVDRRLLPILWKASFRLRLSGRSVFHFFHDLALSYNPWGYLARKVTFASLAPTALCNSHFTAEYIQRLTGQRPAVLYQPVDPQQFNDLPPPASPPLNLQPILRSGVRLILCPARIRNIYEPVINDKNQQALISILVHLRAKGQTYHGVLIGQDLSANQSYSQALLDAAAQAGVADCFSILPPALAIEEYYKYADVVVALSPREPFGRTVVEAIACGIPVIGSQTGGIGEILSQFAPDTWQVDPNDPGAAAAAIVEVAENPDTSTILAKGKEWVKTHCSAAGYARTLLEITGLCS